MNNSYRTLWRWHFYAGLFVMPFLIVLAITGTLYCFQPQIERVVYRDRLVVEPEARPRLSEEALLARAANALPAGAVVSSARISDDRARSAEFVFRLPDGERESVYVNPYTGAVLGTLSVDHRFMQVDRMLHRKLLLGKPGELLMELAACWTLVMIGTGIALWWPKGGFRSARGLFWPNVSMKGRALWRNVHAVMGIWLALGALSFIVTGLPWTGSWGKQFKSLATSANLGAPPGSWGGLRLHSNLQGRQTGAADSSNADGAGHPHAPDTDPMPGMTMDDLPLANIPWAVGAAAVPRTADALEDGARKRLPLDRVIEGLRSLGLSDGYEIAFPQTRDGVYTVTYSPPDPRGERTLYLDQYSGAVLKDIRYSEYGAVAKAVSYGTSLHMGRYFGLANQMVCSFISLGLAAMAVTGCVMWWKRRPAGTLGAPVREYGAPPMRAWKSVLALLGVMFPLLGVSLVAVWVADRAVFGLRSAR